MSPVTPLWVVGDARSRPLWCAFRLMSDIAPLPSWAKTGLVRFGIPASHWITSANGLKTVVTWTLTPTKSGVLVRME
jgi:hypothetical protein